MREEMDDLERTGKALSRGMKGDCFISHLSKPRARIVRTLGPGSPPLSDQWRQSPRYRLALSLEVIEYGAIRTGDKLAAPARHRPSWQTGKKIEGRAS